MANHKKQFCPKGHDTYQVGRLNGSCRACRKETSKLYYRTFNQKAKESIKKWANNHREWIKDKEYQRTYGITLNDYRQMSKNQDNKCAICGAQTDLVVDHNHGTKTARGLLCNNCNRGIGYLKDDAVILNKAAEYLRKFQPAISLN